MKFRAIQFPALSGQFKNTVEPERVTPLAPSSEHAAPSRLEL